MTKSKVAELSQEAFHAALDIWGKYPAKPETWDSMCAWLVGWYMVRDLRVQVTWDHYQTHRAVLKVLDLDTPIEKIEIIGTV